MKSIEYWAGRASQREAIYQAGSRKVIGQVRNAYERAFATIEAEIQAIERNAANASDKEPYAARRLRFEMLQQTIETELDRLAKFEAGITKKHYAGVMNEAYMRTMFDLQKGTGYLFGFARLPKVVITETLRTKWSGKNFSQRVWRNAHVLSKQANEIINAGLMSGTSIDKMVSQLMAVVEPKKLEQAKFVATRLIRTEVNYFANQGEFESYKEAGIERYQYLATLDKVTSQICRDLDNETFPLADAVVGYNYPPMHPFCRSTTIAVIDGRTENNLKRRARDPVTGKTYLIDAGMNYEEWAKTVAG